MADDEIDQTGRDPHRGFGATNVPMPVDAAFGGFASAAPADGDQPADAVEAPEAVPGTRAVRKTRRSADAPPAPEPDEWIVVLETQDERELARISEDLEHGSGRQTPISVLLLLIVGVIVFVLLMVAIAG